MTPAPLSKVIQVVAQATSYHPERNRIQIVERINGVMGMLYRIPAFRQNNCRVEDCTLTRTFTEHCVGCAPRTFVGVVMPAGVTNITELRCNDVLFELTNSRVPGGCGPSRGWNCPPRAERLTPRLLEADIPECRDSRVLTFLSTEIAADCGKPVGARYADMNGREVREDVVLGTSPAGTSTSVLGLLELSFPERSGWIQVETQDGAGLGRYHPSIYSPVHEWFRLEGVGCGVKIGYRGTREPMPVVFDTDMVPFSDAAHWRLAIKAYDNIDSMELESNQIAALNRIMQSLAAVNEADLSAKNLNFNTTLLPETSKRMLSTGRALRR